MGGAGIDAGTRRRNAGKTATKNPHGKERSNASNPQADARRARHRASTTNDARAPVGSSLDQRRERFLSPQRAIDFRPIKIQDVVGPDSGEAQLVQLPFPLRALD